MNAPRGAPEPTDAWTEFFAGACRPDDHCDDPDFLSQEGKANELAELLQHLKYSGSLSAKEVCLISYWASRAGAALSNKKGTVWKMGMKPGLHHYSRHYDEATGVQGNKKYLTTISVPVSNKYDGDRRLTEMPVTAVHELLAHAVNSRKLVSNGLHISHRDKSLPPLY